VRELAEPGLRFAFSGQSCTELHALAGLAGICGGISGRRFVACGGSGCVPARAFEAARPRLLRGTARLVRQTARPAPHEPGFEVAYDASARGEAMRGSGPSRPSRCRADAGEAEGLLVESFHVVVVAHPLEHSALRFEGCCSDAVSEATLPLPSFRRSVAHFVHGTLNLPSFSSDGGEDEQQADLPPFIPPQVWTTADSTAPFYAIGLQFPTATATPEEARRLAAGAERGEPQVYKVLAGRHLTEREIDAWFRRRRGSPICVVDWHACPQYSAPQDFRPFVLDKAGVYYVNAIEQAASTMEMSLLGARNVVNLVVDWVGQRRVQRGF